MTLEERTAEGRGFGELLREWRRHRGLSQLDLASEAGTSPRHVSFLETGRSNPSRTMIVRLSDSLEVPLRERNHLLLSAGFAPAYTEHGVEDRDMSQVRRAIDLLLERHAPYPAYAMDGAWNVIASNQPHRQNVRQLLPTETDHQKNILRLVFDPSGLRPSIANWDECAPVILRRVQRQLSVPDPHPDLARIFGEIRRYPGVESLLGSSVDPSRSELFIPIALSFGDLEIRWMTTILTFGAAIDVTLEELVVECFFPADRESELAYAELIDAATRV